MADARPHLRLVQPDAQGTPRLPPLVGSGSALRRIEADRCAAAAILALGVLVVALSIASAAGLLRVVGLL